MRRSISFTVTFIFALAIITNIFAFVWLISSDVDNYKDELNNRYSFLASTKLFAYENILPYDKVEFRYKKLNMLKIEDEKEISNVVNNALVLAVDSNQMGTSMIFLYGKKNYLYIISKDGAKKELYVDLEYAQYRYIKSYLFAFLVLFSFIFAYVFIMRKLSPLKALKKQIYKFGKNQLEDIEYVGDGNDEISEVAQAFYEASLKIGKLNASRKLFLRNVMHELKTPITKGRITIEMIEDSKYKLRLRECFLRLETLINEFAAIEQITSGFGMANTTCSSIENVIEEAVDKSICSDENIEIKIIESYFVKVDFKLFTTAIKNMIDNAIKYSPNKHVKVVVKKDKIDFLNCGDGLDRELEYYEQAFMRNGACENGKCENSFGLGLYIVSSILKEHKVKLDYEYINGVNHFSFINLGSIVCEKSDK